MKGFLIRLFCFLFSTSAFAQSVFLPAWSPYGGVYNLNFNPAISDSRHFADVNILAVSLSNASSGFDHSFETLYPFDLKSRYKMNKSGSSNPFINESAFIMGPSVIFSGGKNRKNVWAFGLSSELNEVLDMDHVDTSLYRAFAANQSGQLPQSTFLNQNLFYASWLELKPTAGYTVFDKKKHFVKVGVSARILQGFSAYQFNAGEMSVINVGNDSVQVALKNVDSFRSEELRMEFDEITRKPNSAAPSFSGEIGVIYEFRALRDSVHYYMNEKRWMNHENIKYLISAGVSFSPSVQVQYVGENYSLIESKALIPYSRIQSASSLDSVYTNILSQFSNVKSTETKRMKLPAKLNVFADVNIYKGIGLNISSTIHPGQAAGFRSNIYQPDFVTLAPRFDNSLYGASLPVTWQRWDPLSRENTLLAGVTLRFGPISVAAHYNLSASQISQLNVGLKIPVRYKNLKDKDGDMVDDTRDLCVIVPGQYTAMGCPDSDLDSIPNDQDRCQWEKGPRKFRGCPDKDGDDIPDIDDRCKDVFGLVQFEGCADTDGDNVPDDVDECDSIPGLPKSMGCPDFDDDGVYDPWDDCDSIPGPKEFKGCPDRDGDGILDMDDDCPDEKGDLLDGGCPDRDNDGTLDKNDYCPDEKGSFRNHGCPNEDADEDGLWDFEDDCPDDFGPKSNRGCPKKDKFPNQKKQLVLRINDGFDLDLRNRTELDSISSLLQKYPDYSVRIIGFADSLGTDEEKKTLSVQRARIAREHIENNGIDGARILTSAEGNIDPIEHTIEGENNLKYGRIEVYVLFKDK